MPIVLPKIEDDSSHIFHQYVIRVNERDKLQAFLKEKGIQTGIYYLVPYTCRSLPTFGFKRGDFPEAEKAALTSLALPVYPELKRVEKDYIVQSIRRFFNS